MAMTSDERKYLEDVLDKCDGNLTDKPTLSTVYDAMWRRDFRRRTLSVQRINEVRYPAAYALPQFDRYYPADLQARIEEGAALFFPKVCDAERNHFVARLRSESASAQEELLLVRGLAAEFGQARILAPSGTLDQSRPEFSLCTDGVEIDFEAKGLFDSVKTSGLRRAAIDSGRSCCVTASDVTHDLNRLRGAVARKMKQGRRGIPKIIVLTQYTPWPTRPEAAVLIRRLALEPSEFDLPDEIHALAVAYVFECTIQGVWFNQSVASRHAVLDTLIKRLRSGVRESFYPRPDGIFLSDHNDEQAHADLIRRIWDRRPASDPGEGPQDG